MNIRRAFVLAVYLAAAPELQAMTVTPIAHLTALGGQYFTGQTHSTGVNIDASLVPVLTLRPNLYLIPIYLGTYNETQSVYNFLGETTLIQKQMDHTGVLRAAWSPSEPWRIKPRIGFKKEWTQQTTDDSLWNGLFNYNRFFTGVSAERTSPWGSLEMGYEYSQTRYRNYQALDADPRLTSTGITASAGRDVLNFNSHETSLIFQRASPDKRHRLEMDFSWVREGFIDQKVITSNESGLESFVSTQRTDDVFSLTASPLWAPSPRWTVAYGATLQYYLSNQNGFDATQVFATPFTYRYYNFTDLQWTPAVTRSWLDQKIQLTLAGTLGYRAYSHRRAQDGTGTYQDKLIYSLDRGTTLTFRYRLIPRLSAVVTASVLTYSSNTRYEVNYPYNYTVSNYLAGFSFDL